MKVIKMTLYGGMLAMALLNSLSGHTLGHALWYQVVLALGAVGITVLAAHDAIGLCRARSSRCHPFYWPSVVLIVCWSVLCLILTVFFWYNAVRCLLTGQPLDIYGL